MKLLADIPHEYLLNNMRRNWCQHDARPAWAMVRDLCGVGSTTARSICAQMLWNPDIPANAPPEEWAI